MKIYYSLMLTFWGATTVQATPASFDNIYLTIDSGVAFGQDDKTRSESLQFGVAHELSQYFDLGVNWTRIGHVNENSAQGMEVYLRSRYPLSEDADIYLDTGAWTEGRGITTGVGIEHELNSQWGLDVGYRYYSEPNNSIQGDVYTFALGVNYYFSPREVGDTSIVSDSTYSSVNRVESRLVEDAPKKEKEKEKEKEIDNSERLHSSITNKPTKLSIYTIVEGDWGMKIAQQQGITLESLMVLNPWFAERVRSEGNIYPGETLFMPPHTTKVID